MVQGVEACDLLELNHEDPKKLFSSPLPSGTSKVSCSLFKFNFLRLHEFE